MKTGLVVCTCTQPKAPDIPISALSRRSPELEIVWLSKRFMTTSRWMPLSCLDDSYQLVIADWRLHFFVWPLLIVRWLFLATLFPLCRCIYLLIALNLYKFILVTGRRASSLSLRWWMSAKVFLVTSTRRLKTFSDVLINSWIRDNNLALCREAIQTSKYENFSTFNAGLLVM